MDVNAGEPGGVWVTPLVSVFFSFFFLGSMCKL